MRVNICSHMHAEDDIGIVLSMDGVTLSFVPGEPVPDGPTPNSSEEVVMVICKDGEEYRLTMSTYFFTHMVKAANMVMDSTEWVDDNEEETSTLPKSWEDFS